MRGLALACVVTTVVACSDSAQTTPTAPQKLAQARFEMTAVILGPPQNDDDADLRVTVQEMDGVGARLNFLRLTCSNGAAQEWGAGSFVSELGSNRIAGKQTLVVVRHYRCPNSSRPARLLADLTDENGFHHQVITAPYHPSWPGA